MKTPLRGPVALWFLFAALASSLLAALPPAISPQELAQGYSDTTILAQPRARLAEFAPLGREAAFRRVYQIPGMTKVNQALGRLVRAPGQRARVLLHCRRFLEPSYASLLARDYQFGANILTDADLATWLDS